MHLLLLYIICHSVSVGVTVALYRQGGGDDPDNADELAMQDYFENLLADAEVTSGDEEESEVLYSSLGGCAKAPYTQC